MSEQLRHDQTDLQQIAGTEPDSETALTPQDEVVVDPALAAEINESGPDRLSLPPGRLTLEQAQQILHCVVENRRAAARDRADSLNTSSTEQRAINARIKRAENKLAEKKAEVAAAVAKYTPSSRFPTDRELSKEVTGIQAKGTPLELLKEQVFRAHAEHHLPQLTAIVVDFVQGDAQTAERTDFEDALNTGEISTINLERDELWAAIVEARQERTLVTEVSSSGSEEPEELTPDEPDTLAELPSASAQEDSILQDDVDVEPRLETPEYAVTNFVVLGTVMGRLVNEYATETAGGDNFPTADEIATAYEAEGLPPLRPTVLTNAVQQAQEEITEERARIARTAEQEAALQAEEAVEITPEPTAIEQARVTVLPDLIATEHPVGRPFFRLALNRADIMLTLEEEDELYAELRAARGEEPEEVVADIPLRQIDTAEPDGAASELSRAAAESEPTEDDVIADVMGEYFGDGVVPEIEELRARFAERGVPQADADLAQLHGAIADMVTEEQDRVAAAAEVQRLAEEAQARERAERAMEEAVVQIIAARDWMHPTATAGDRGTTVQDIVAYQRITEDGEDGIDRVLAGQNVFHDVLQGDQFQHLTIEQRRQVLREVGDRLRLDFKESRKKANDSYDNLSQAEDRTKKSQQTLESSRIVPPTKPAPEITDTTMYREDTTGPEFAAKTNAYIEKKKTQLKKAGEEVKEAGRQAQMKKERMQAAMEDGSLGTRIMQWIDKKVRIKQQPQNTIPEDPSQLEQS